MAERETTPSKSVALAYAAWCCGLHYLYLDDRDRLVRYWLTLGGLGFWAIRDLLAMRFLVETHNQGGVLAGPLVPNRSIRPILYFLKRVAGLPPERWLAVDFETATESRDSVCAVGYAVLEGNRIVESGQWLVRPPGNRYAELNVKIHGISPAATAAAPTFAETWPRLRGLLEGSRVLMHWSKFDTEVIRACIERDGLERVSFRYADTVGMAKMAFPGLPSHKLPHLARLFGFPLSHHSSESDAAVLARVADRCRQAVYTLTLSEACELLVGGPNSFETYSTASPLGGFNLMEPPPVSPGETVVGKLSGRTAMPEARLVTDGQRFFLLPIGGERTPVSPEVVEQLRAAGYVNE